MEREWGLQVLVVRRELTLVLQVLVKSSVGGHRRGGLQVLARRELMSALQVLDKSRVGDQRKGRGSRYSSLGGSSRWGSRFSCSQV